MRSTQHRCQIQQIGILAQFLILVLLSATLTACVGTTNNRQTITSTPSSAPVQLGPTSTSIPVRTPESPADPTPTLLPIPAMDEDDHSIGGINAAITVLVYSDFQCPHCANFYQAWDQIKAHHPDDVRLVFRHFPLLTLHDKADIAGAASEIAAKNDRFWEMHDTLFERQDEWTNLDRDAFVEWLTDIAEEIELDPGQFLEDLISGVELEAMVEDYQEGLRAGIPGTPFIFFNGEWYRLNPTVINLEASIQLDLLKSRQYAEPPQVELGVDTLYFAHLELDEGELVIQLYPDLAPATVASFIFLAEEGWFDDIGFHRVQFGRSVESGDPTGTGLGGPGYLMLDELSDTLSFDEIGMVAMSSSGPNTNGSRFFINLMPLPHLNGTRTIFGRVIDGLEFITELDEREPYQDLLKPYELIIHSVRIESR